MKQEKLLIYAAPRSRRWFIVYSVWQRATGLGDILRCRLFVHGSGSSADDFSLSLFVSMFRSVASRPSRLLGASVGPSAADRGLPEQRIKNQMVVGSDVISGGN